MQTRQQIRLMKMMGGAFILAVAFLALFGSSNPPAVYAQAQPTIVPTFEPVDPMPVELSPQEACVSPCTFDLNNIFLGTTGNPSRILEFNPQTNANTGKVWNWPIAPQIGAITPDGKRLFMAGRKYGSYTGLYEIELSTYTMTTKIPVIGEDQRGLVISKDGTHLYVADNYFRKLTIVDLQSNQIEETIQLGTHPEQIALSPDDSCLYIAGSMPGKLVVINTATNSASHYIPVSGYPHGVNASRNGRHIFLDIGSAIMVLNASDFSLVTTMNTKTSAPYLFSNADGSKLYALGGYSSNVLQIFSTMSFTLVKKIDLQAKQFTGAVSRDGAYIYIGTSTGLVVMDAFTDKIIHRASFSQSPYAVVAVPGKSIPPDLLIQNGGFNGYTTSTSMIPIAWQVINFAATDGKSTTAMKEGTSSVMIDGADGVTKTLYQVLLLSGEAGDRYTFTYWVKGTAIPVDANFCRGQVFVYNDTSLVTAQTIDCPIHTYAEFQKKALAFTIPGVYNKVVVRFTYSKPTGRIWFDMVSLVKK